MTYNTGNPIGSTDARDRLDNSENMDILENSTTLNAHADRLGTMRKTRKGMELEHYNQMQSFENDFDSRLAGMAFTRVGTFTAGATLTDMRQTLLWEVSQGGDGREYGWIGSFLPSGKVVAAGSTPATSGGVGAGAWVDRTDVVLRDDLAGIGGAGLIGGSAKPVTWEGFAGGADLTGSASSVAAFSAAKAQGSTTYIPKGVYLIDSSVDLSNSEWDFARGAVLNITGAAVVTIGNVKAGLYNIFSGSGGVVFSNENEVAYPEWFGAVLADGIVGLEKCLAACDPNNVRMHIANNLRLSRTWIINGRVPITCNPRASFDATGAAVTNPLINGVEIREGAVNWNCKVQLPNIAGFKGAGIVLRGCSLIDLEVGAIASCTDGLVFKTVAGSAPNCLDNNVRVQSIQGCGTALVATGDNSANIFQGNEIYVNFVVGCNKAVEYRSAVALPNFDSNTWEFSAIDGAIAGSVGLKNSTPSSISKVNFNVKTWAGGFGSAGKFVDGRFNGSIVGLRINGEPAYSAMAISGAGNKISYERSGWTDMVVTQCVFNAATALADFNGGVPVNNNQIQLRITVPSNIPVGSSIVAYACTPLDDGGSLLFSITPTNPSGMSINYVRREAKNVVRINWTNNSAAAVPAGDTIDFTLNIG